jgi:hypothetical protein
MVQRYPHLSPTPKGAAVEGIASGEFTTGFQGRLGGISRTRGNYVRVQAASR